MAWVKYEQRNGEQWWHAIDQERTANARMGWIATLCGSGTGGTDRSVSAGKVHRSDVCPACLRIRHPLPCDGTWKIRAWW